MKTGFLYEKRPSAFDKRWLPKALLASAFAFAAALDGVQRSTAASLVTAARASLVATATLASAVIMLTAAFLMATPPAFAATGDLVTALTFSQNCSSGIGVGITFDGTNLWVSCYNS